ncbi:MAG: membrane protein insertion efficiency factor YidD [Epulopiscium sp.]|nr:membrane protein insertion efficiency factor YidD [Candidatus Epulonipiscium sp.]
MKEIDGAIRKMVVGYQKYISPYKQPCCRFYPTCSQYMYDAVGKYGAVKGVFLGTKRIFRCHPFHPGGYDPVP